MSLKVCAEASFSKNLHYLYCKSIDCFPYDQKVSYLFIIFKLVIFIKLVIKVS